jgi:serine/threonine protein phosphatase PrpC
MKDYRVFAVSVQGFNHKKEGQEKECQDYSLAIRIGKHHYEVFTGDRPCSEQKKQNPLKPKPYCCIAIVADGHGGDVFFRSAYGSKFASESARYCFSDFFRSMKKTPKESDLHQLIRSIVKTWNEKAKADFDGKPFGNSELSSLPEKTRKKYELAEDYRNAYGTTLIATGLCENYWFGIHIGDGRCVILKKDGTFEQPIRWDPRCYMNVTTSICDDDAAEGARIFMSDEKPAAIFLCSDGIDDSFPVNDNEKHLAKFFRALTIDFANKEFNTVYNDITNSLPVMSEKGSGDDMSIAGIIDTELLKQLVPILENQIKEEKITSEEIIGGQNNSDNIEKELPVDSREKIEESGLAEIEKAKIRTKDNSAYLDNGSNNTLGSNIDTNV